MGECLIDSKGLLFTRRRAIVTMGVGAACAVWALSGCATTESVEEPAEKEGGQDEAGSQGSLETQQESIPLPRRCACVTEYAGNTLALIDLDLHEIVGRMPMGQNPSMMAYGSGVLYVGASGEGKVYAVDAATGVASSCEVGNQPIGLCLDEAAGILYVADYFDSTIRMVDTQLMSVVGSVRLSATGFHNRTDPPDCCRKTPGVGRRPVAVALSPDGDVVYCANYGTYDIGRINTATSTEIEAFDGVVGPRTLAVSRDGGSLVLAGVGGEDEEQVNELYVVDRDTGERTSKVFVGMSVADVCLTQDGSTAFSIARDSGELVCFDAETWNELGRAYVGEGVESMDLSPDESLVLVANSQTGSLGAFDAATLDLVFGIEGLANPKDVVAVEY